MSFHDFSSTLVCDKRNKNAYAGPHTAVGWNLFYFFLIKKTIVGFRILEIFTKVNITLGPVGVGTKMFHCGTSRSPNKNRRTNTAVFGIKSII